jgi:hypothetical protein
MTESDLPYIKQPTDIPPETNELIPPSPDVKNPLPNHEPIDNSDAGDFICPICGKPFNTKPELDLHMAKKHEQTKKA